MSRGATCFAARPALCAIGISPASNRHLSQPKGYHTGLHVLCVLGFMAQARIHRTEQLRHKPPGERAKPSAPTACRRCAPCGRKSPSWPPPARPASGCASCAATGCGVPPRRPTTSMCSATCAITDRALVLTPVRLPPEALPARQHHRPLSQRRDRAAPFFVVSDAVTDGLSATLLDDIRLDLLAAVPGPTHCGTARRRPAAESFRRRLRLRGLPPHPPRWPLAVPRRSHHLPQGIKEPRPESEPT